MVSRFVPRLLARGLGAADGFLEPPPLAVAEQRLQIARAPIFGTMIVMALERLERGLGGGKGGVSHCLCSPVDELDALSP